MDTSFKGKAVRLADIDIPRIGTQIGVGEDELHAFMDVEASGSAFDAKGRPKMLFEPHRFYALLGKGAKRDAAVKAGLAYAKWGTKPYPKDSYPRLIKAMAIDEAAALKAASWGLTQIMGEWHKDIGYATPQAMVEAFKDSAAAHLDATVKLLVAWKVDDDLRAHRWAVVAETWNGTGYKKNKYDTKLAARFKWWQGKADTAYTPAEVSKQTWIKPAGAKTVEVIVSGGGAGGGGGGGGGGGADDSQKTNRITAQLDLDKATIERVQQQLKDLGYTEVGGIDGKVGTLTATAIRAFRAENGLSDGDQIDDDLLLALQKAKPRAIAPARSEAAPEVVREKVPEVRTNWLTKVGAFFTGIASLTAAFFDGIVGNLGSAAGYIQPVKDAVGDMPGWVWFVLIAVIAGGLFLVARHGEQKGVEAFQTGARR